MLKIVQTFDPPGVAARDLRECLMLQMERAGSQKTVEYRIVRDFMDALYQAEDAGDRQGIGADSRGGAGGGETDHLPGTASGPRAYLPDDERYVLPEVFVTKVGDDYVVTTNNEQIPHLRISNLYKDLMSQADMSEEGSRRASISGKKSAPGNS